jgi:protein-S-isoprenylcysteine O-methyltransferase Ste14
MIILILSYIEEHGMKEITRLRLKIVIFLPLLYFINWLAYFIPAGRFDFPLAWMFFILQLTNAFLLSFLMDEELLKERLSRKPDAKKWDILFNRVYFIFGILIYILAGLDVGYFHVSPILPFALKITALFLLISAAVIADWSVLVNKFFSRFVRIQKDRGHYVIDKGPYSLVRHPGYLSILIVLAGVPILLNSLLAYIPAVLCALSVIWRTKKEDAALKNELPGYTEYSKRVKYRLVPAIF